MESRGQRVEWRVQNTDVSQLLYFGWFGMCQWRGRRGKEEGG